MMRYLAFIVVVSVLSVSLFGFAAIAHGAIGCNPAAAEMNGGGCPQAIMAMALHHISAYNAFTSVPVGAGLSLLILSLLMVAVTSALSLCLFPPLEPLAFAYTENCPPLDSRSIKLSSWLSLFENSPSLI